MQSQTAISNFHKIWNWLKWRRLIGFTLIIAGVFLISTFIKPYLLYYLWPAPLEANHPNKSGDRIFIPGIKLDAPLYESYDQLDHGIIISASDDLGKGNTVLEGHNIAKHGPLFSLLYLVRTGDRIALHFQGKRYAYVVKKRMIVKPDVKDRFIRQTSDERLTLITCYPPTSTAMRLVVIAKPEKAK